MRYTLSVIIIFLAAGCSTTHISLHTTPPRADVYTRPVGSAEFRHFGKTPLYLTNAQLEKENLGSGAVQVQLRMEGFKDDDLIITEISQVDLSINRDLQPKRDFEQQAWLNEHVQQLFRVRDLVQSNQYKEALRLVRSLREQTPMVATIHQLEGGIQLLLRDYAAALQAYREAGKLDPENSEAIKMARQLERSYGFRKEVNVLDSEMNNQKRMPASPAGSP